uniref:RNA-dependent RNA polymerase n=1 Tax=Merch tombus-like virus TaxID=2716735 RepID=A0A6G7PSS9_9TOMB|nr:RNA-dependent RNA polymerase [Merch tombus-like virus]
MNSLEQIANNLERESRFNIKKHDWLGIRKDLAKRGIESIYFTEIKEQEEAFWSRLLDPTESGKLCFEGYGIHLISEAPINRESPSTLVKFSCAGREWMAIKEVAESLGLLNKYTDGQYNSLMISYNMSTSERMQYYPGTTYLADTLHNMRVAQRIFMKRHSKEFQVDGHTTHFMPQVEKKDTEDGYLVTKIITPVPVPPRLPYEHMDNRLYNPDTEYEPHPELDDAWIRFVDQMRYCDNPTYTGVKSKLPPAEPLNYDPMRLNHPEYGQYGYFNYPLKADFKGQTEPNQIQQPSTYSVALTDHLPAFLPRWNRRSAHTNLYGGAGRVGRLPVDPKLIDYRTMDPYLDEAGDLLIRLLEQAGLHTNQDQPRPIDAWKWLAASKFPGPKKFKYAQAFVAVEANEEEFIAAEYFSNVHKAFPKNELYVGMDKPQRQILAGDLQMAAVMAPICDEIGNYFFSLPFTSKKIPERLRPRMAIERFGDGRVLLNDMSAYEGSITPHIKEHCENRIFRHFYPNASSWIARTTEDLSLYVQGASFTIDNCRCSGDPQTSLGNSITNFMSICAAYGYACRKLNVPMVTADGLAPWVLNEFTAPVCWVEGDDSLVKYDHNFERPGFYDAYKEAFIKMGFATKLEISDFAGNAGYCSMFFTDKARNSPSIGQTLLDFPWCHDGTQNRGREYLSLKALSLANSAPGQPITWALAMHYAPTSNQIVSLRYNSYEHEELLREGYDVRIRGSRMDVHMNPLKNRIVQPDDDDREFFFRRYLITPKEQMNLEQDILKHGMKAIVDHGMFVVRQVCSKEGLDYDAYHKFYEDNVDCDRIPEQEHYTMKRTEYEVVDGKLVAKEYYARKKPKAPIVKVYPEQHIVEKGVIERKVYEENVLQYRAKLLGKYLKRTKDPRKKDIDLFRGKHDYGWFMNLIHALFIDPAKHFWAARWYKKPWLLLKYLGWCLLTMTCLVSLVLIVVLLICVLRTKDECNPDDICSIFGMCDPGPEMCPVDSIWAVLRN